MAAWFIGEELVMARVENGRRKEKGCWLPHVTPPVSTYKKTLEDPKTNSRGSFYRK